MKSAQIKDGKLRIEELPIPSIASGVTFKKKNEINMKK